ncbi:MAG: hypothetical protein ACWGN2_00070 [Anaerolineales bacterium]
MSKRRKRTTTTRARSRVTSESITDSQKLPEDFNPDYTYVKKDLKTIGILASIFITILVILSFIL